MESEAQVINIENSEIKNQQSVHVKGKLSVGMQEVSGWGSKFIYVLVADEVRIENAK